MSQVTVKLIGAALLLTAWIAISAAYNCNSKCQNGDCVAYLGELSCQCHGNWSGEACDQFVCEIANPCLNNGVCSVHPGDSSKYMCSCPSGYLGNRCEFKIPDGPQSVCADNPCGSHAVCFETSDRYYCNCHKGYYGPTCNFTNNVCAQENCNGNGYCQVVPNRFGNPFPLCTCKEFYGSIDPIPGIQCLYPNRYDNCFPSVDPCKNGGVCKLVDYPEAYTCTCPPAFHGKNCELPFDVCSNETQRCFNGGTCQPDGHYFTCTCPPNYIGERCEFVIDPCLDKLCLNGGKCVVSGTKQPDGYCDHSNVTASCECSSGYSGEQCEVPPATGQTVSSTSDSSLPTRCAGSFCRSSKSHTKKCMKGPDEDSLYCICEAGWGGERCDLDIDECFEKPCAEGERCTNIPGMYICTSTSAP